MTQPIIVDPPRAAKPRVVWVDYAKGLSILFVVVYHVWNGIMTRSHQIATPVEWYEPINRAFEMMRMPLFFFVSGLFIGKSVQKPAGTFISDKIGAIAWPYLIWSCVHVGVTMLLAKVAKTTSEFDFAGLGYHLAIDPVAQFWFLYVLFMSLMLYFAMSKLRLPVWGILLAGIGLLLVKLNVNLSPVGFETSRYTISLAKWGPFYQLMNFFIYMALGAVLAPVLLKKLDRQSGWLMTFIAVVAIVSITLAVWKGSPSLVSRDAVRHAGSLRLPVGIIFALISVAGALCAAVLMSRARGFGFVRTMGQFSLYIFVMHVIFAAGTRTLLLKVGVSDFTTHLTLGLMVGILVPIGVAILVKRAGATWLFTLRPG